MDVEGADRAAGELPRVRGRQAVGVKGWASQVQAQIGSLDGKVIGVDLWSPMVEKEIREAFHNRVRRWLLRRHDAGEGDQDTG